MCYECAAVNVLFAAVAGLVTVGFGACGGAGRSSGETFGVVASVAQLFTWAPQVLSPSVF
jgi:hypothetical protein